MNLPPETRRLLIPAVWLGTAVLTFCIGRMSSYIDAPTGTGPEIARVPESVAVETDARLSATPISLNGADYFANPLNQVTGGQPIADWLKRVMNTEDEIARMNGFMRLLDVLTTGAEIEQALEAVSPGSNGWARGKEFSMLLQKWAQLDPAKAITYVEKLNDQNAKFGGYRAVLSTWTRRSPQEAIAWADQNGASTNEQEGNRAMATVIGQLAKTDPDWALKLTQGQPKSVARGRMVDAVIDQYMSQRGREATREMVMSIPEETLRNGMIGRLAGHLAATDPVATAQWARMLPDGEGRQRATTETFSRWFEKDLESAASSLSTYPISSETDESRARLAQNVLRNDPEGALAWAGTISEEQSRTRAVTDLIRNWMRRDADAAGRWVQSSQLPPDVKAKLGFPSPQSTQVILR